MMENPLRTLPSIKQIQDSDIYQRLKNTLEISEDYLTKIAKKIVDEYRQQLTGIVDEKAQLTKDKVLKKVLQLFEESVKEYLKPALIPVINGTGIILHTNLGRARLAPRVVQAIQQAASSYTDLEFDLGKGERGLRYEKIESLLTLITGAEAALVVNNNAAAVFLILRAFAKNKEVIVSRGELVEIGGSFRVSSIMAESDAQLVEVGTTNKTHLRDYVEAITDNTAMLMKVHRSNFSMIGFTAEVNRQELSLLARDKQLIFYEDLGSGAFFDFKSEGIGDEPILSQIVRENVDIVSASGDKLLGGPQVGIILGKKKLIDELKKHQLTRTLRVDKLTLAGLAETLKAYLSTQQILKVPTVRDITQPVEEIQKRAQYLKTLLDKLNGLDTYLCETLAYVGGGTMPGVTLKSYGLRIHHSEESVNDLAYKLRNGTPSVVGRIEDEQFILDCRTIADEEIEGVYRAFQQLFS